MGDGHSPLVRFHGLRGVRDRDALGRAGIERKTALPTLNGKVLIAGYQPYRPGQHRVAIVFDREGLRGALLHGHLTKINRCYAGRQLPLGVIHSIYRVIVIAAGQQGYREEQDGYPYQRVAQEARSRCVHQNVKSFERKKA